MNAICNYFHSIMTGKPNVTSCRRLVLVLKMQTVQSFEVSNKCKSWDNCPKQNVSQTVKYSKLLLRKNLIWVRLVYFKIKPQFSKRPCCQRPLITRPEFQNPNSVHECKKSEHVCLFGHLVSSKKASAVSKYNNEHSFILTQNAFWHSLNES